MKKTALTTLLSIPLLFSCYSPRTIVFPFRSELADYTYEEWTLDYDAGAYVFETDQVISWTRGIGFFRGIAHIRVF